MIYTAFNTYLDVYYNAFEIQYLETLGAYADRAEKVNGMVKKSYLWINAASITEIPTSQDAKTLVPNLNVFYSHTQAVGQVSG